MSTMDITDTGIETANHLPQSRGGSISPMAIKFWGEEIGDVWPPILAASAIASYSNISNTRGTTLMDEAYDEAGTESRSRWQGA